MAEFRLDLTKAKAAPNHLYFIRLSRALNDLLSVMQSIQAVNESSSLPVEFKKHLKTYLLSIQHGHLVEACKAFVYNIEKNPTHANPVRTWLKANPALYRIFSELRSMLDDPLYTNLRDYRDSLVFHYDSDNQSKQTEDAFSKQVSLWEQFSKQGASNLNLIVIGDEDYQQRFLIADHLTWMHWGDQLGLAGSKAKAAAIISFQARLYGRFRKFANEAFMQWCEENGLFMEK